MDQTQLNRESNITDLNREAGLHHTLVNATEGEGTPREDMVIGGIYKVKERMEVSTGEADLYLCTDGMSEYVAKVYRRKIAIKDGVAETLQSIDSPYVASVYATGEYEGKPYEILPYYREGSLEGKLFTFEELKKHIVPALNEGLKVLHDAGIIHKDLKPSNIMMQDNGQDVAIIDFGISSLREEGNTVILTRTGMTPEYSAPETFKNLFLIESDYYSLGITLYELFCGHAPYANMTSDAIERFVSVQKLPLPPEMDEDLKVLISALTYPDITNRRDKTNPNRRWGYEEVLRWCAGVPQAVPGMASGTMESQLRPYQFMGAVYTNKKDLVAALNLHWEEGKKQLYRGLLSAYFKGIDAESAGACMDAEEAGADKDKDLLFFETLYRIDTDLKALIWKGKVYDTPADFGNVLLDALWHQQSNLDEFTDELLMKQVLSHYILILDPKDKARAEVMQSIETSYGKERFDARTRLMKQYELAYLLSGRKVYFRQGTEYEDVQALTKELQQLLYNSYFDFEQMCKELTDKEGNPNPQLESWLRALGKESEIETWKKTYRR